MNRSIFVFIPIGGCVVLFLGLIFSIAVASVLVVSARSELQDVQAQLAALKSDHAKLADSQAEIASLNGKVSASAKSEASARAEVASLQSQLAKAKADTKKALDTIAALNAKKPIENKPAVATNPKVTRENFKKIFVGTDLSDVEKLLGGPGDEVSRTGNVFSRIWRSSPDKGSLAIHVTFRLSPVQGIDATVLSLGIYGN